MKTIAKLTLATAIMIMIAAQSNAQSTNSASQPAQKQNNVNAAPGNFVDKDNNGVCDNFESRSGKGRGANYIDKNNDGVCDNRANAGSKQGNRCMNGQGNQYGHGHGRGHGCCGRR